MIDFAVTSFLNDIVTLRDPVQTPRKAVDRRAAAAGNPAGAGTPRKRRRDDGLYRAPPLPMQ